MNITVYLGSSEGKDVSIKEAVRSLGEWIGSSGHCLVYGGSKIGLMGVLAESVVKSGGKATGVEPQFFIDKVLQYDGLSELFVTEDMWQRKSIMVEKGDAFVAMPGGTGTLEEITEIMSAVALGHIDAPCILYNHEGYYDSLKELMGKMLEYGFSEENRLKGIYFADSVDEIKRIIENAEK